MLPSYAPGNSRCLKISGKSHERRSLLPSQTPCPPLREGEVVEFVGSGLEFLWTSLHKDQDEIRDMRMVGDSLADAALSEILDSKASPEEKSASSSSKGKHKLDFLGSVVKQAAAKNAGPCADFVRSIERDPPFHVDWDSVARGQDFFLRRGPSTAIALLHLSLVGGFSSPGINQVLYGTGYLTSSKPSVVQLRLFETMCMVVDCMAGGPETLRNMGKGVESVARVRLLHAFVRRRLQRRMQGWDKEKNGVPINQGDMAITGLSFSVNVIFGSEALGCPPSKQDIKDYVHLWKLITHKIGVLPEYNPHDDYDTAVARLESYVITCVDPDESSVRASAVVLGGVANQPPFFLSYQRMAALSRCCMGDNLADALALPKYSLGDRFFLVVVKSLLRVQSTIADFHPKFFSRRGAFMIRAHLEMFLGEGGAASRSARNARTGGSERGKSGSLTRFGGFDDEERDSALRKLEDNLMVLKEHRESRRVGLMAAKLAVFVTGGLGALYVFRENKQ